MGNGTSGRFTALQLDDTDGLRARVVELGDDDLRPGEVTVDVEYSSINYKDALAVTGRGKIIREFPFIPGVDFAGVVRHSDSARFAAGDRVVATGCQIGERHFGGLSQRARVDAALLQRLPDGMTAKEAMQAGTAGFTAALCVMAIEERPLPEAGDLVVSGASGGVGSYAVAMLSASGRDVVAVSRPEAEGYLGKIGAGRVIPREEMAAEPRALEKQRWAAAVDTVGGDILSRIIAETAYNGTVACCGLAAGPKLATTVMPFILRGVRLVGIDSVMYALDRRHEVWGRLAAERGRFGDIRIETVGLADVAKCCEAVLEGSMLGRFVVDVNR